MCESKVRTDGRPQGSSRLQKEGYQRRQSMERVSGVKTHILGPFVPTNITPQSSLRVVRGMTALMDITD